ncbi:MAG: DUF5074 domain-containing protein [Odoribacteraceae bacterium]|jgi:hypothetical protein|nr:DUF5074 domain-containing protein [Odoribacteraceae bacterium]
MKKNQFNLLVVLFAIFFASCQEDGQLFLSSEQNETRGEKVAIVGDNYLGNPGGIYVLSEGNMTSENGALSFIDASDLALSDFPAQNDVIGSGTMGNVSQDLFIADNKMYIVNQNGDIDQGAQNLFRTDSTLTESKSSNPGGYFAEGWSGNTPTHLAVSGATIYVRTNDGVVITDTSTFTDGSTPPTPLDGISTPSRTRRAMISNDGVKYLYVGSENNVVYRINTTNNFVDKIAVEGTVAGLVAVRRDNKATQYVYAFGITSSTTAVLSKISRDTVISRDTIDGAPLDPGLFIPSVGLCCYAGAVEDIVYFRSNNWDPTTIYRYEVGTGDLITLYTVPDGIDERAQIIYGDLGVDPRTGDLYFGYVGNWGAFATVNGIGRLRKGDPNSIQEYRASYNPPYKIDTHFTAGIYFNEEFDM